MANVQGVLDRTGHAATVEINPRFSGGLALSLAAGSDFVASYVRAVLHPGEQITPLYFRPRTRMVRHFEEVFEQAPPAGTKDSDAGSPPAGAP